MIQGLGAAHARGVIHRDLKPENILVQLEAPGIAERLVIVDFGLAGMLDENNDPHPNLTKSRMTMGTVNYLAPEQRTDAKRVDQRADLYAAGVIFYELLTGNLPLGRFALPTERGVPVPLSVDRCIVRALARGIPTSATRWPRSSTKTCGPSKPSCGARVGQDTVIGRTKAPGGIHQPQGRRRRGARHRRRDVGAVVPGSARGHGVAAKFDEDLLMRSYLRVRNRYSHRWRRSPCTPRGSPRPRRFRLVAALGRQRSRADRGPSSR